MIDLHCHVLPGIDDGPESIEGSLELARAAVAAGMQTVVATPHVSWRYQNSAETIARLVEELNARLRAEEVALVLRPGSEIAFTRLVDMAPHQLDGLRLGGGRWLLVEPPFAPVVTGLDTLLLRLQSQGERILLAHPERCQAFHRDRGMLESLVRSGVLTSVTAGSLTGRFGERVRHFAVELVRDAMVHNVASDAHDHDRRPPGIAAELQRAGLSSLTDWLTREVPMAILDGGEIPSRPSVDPDVEGARRRWWRRHP